ncbi:MAG TPA: acyl-ACP--UDP-N-acetylglucosamine O-acyltransferase [Chthoniobacterales bacterium]|nr:acyl-ACP--UDP-N-acetylglucosamine O-acyltransferase [Chthoniobacterales bacterium]
MKIHETAIIEAGAQIGAEVEIGPFSIVSAEAVIGEKCVIQSHVVIEGAVRMGAGNFVGHGAVIGAAPQDLNFQPQTKSQTEIGDANVIREHCTIHRGATEGSATVLGNGNFLMVNAHVGHDCKIGNGVVIVNDCLLAGHVRIDDRAFIGGGSRFHQGIRIGRVVMAEGRFTKNLPPFLIAAKNQVFGVNTLGLRRAGFSPADRDEIKRAFKLLYTSGLNTKQALEKAAEAEFGAVGREFFAFVAEAGKRGIVSYSADPEGED